MCHCKASRSEDNYEGPVLSFHRVSPRIQTQIISLGSRCLYPLSHLSICFSLKSVILVGVSIAIKRNHNHAREVYKTSNPTSAVTHFPPARPHLLQRVHTSQQCQHSNTSLWGPFLFRPRRYHPAFLLVSGASSPFPVLCCAVLASDTPASLPGGDCTSSHSLRLHKTQTRQMLLKQLLLLFSLKGTLTYGCNCFDNHRII